MKYNAYNADGKYLFDLEAENATEALSKAKELDAGVETVEVRDASDEVRDGGRGA